MKKHVSLVSLILFTSFVLAACGSSAMPAAPTPTSTLTLTSIPTLTLTPTLTPAPTSTITPTPTPLVATFDDQLCDIKGSFFIDGELSFTGVYAHLAIENDIEGAPSYALSLYGNSKNGDFHNLSIWVKHNASPHPNEMADLPKNFKDSDIKIYASDKTELHATQDKVHLKLHVIPLQLTQPGDDPIGNCEYVVEEIQVQSLGSVEVIVKNVSGNPVAGALVIIVMDNDQPKGKTDAKGRFVFEDVPPGSYLVGCGQEGGQMVLGGITVKGEKMSTVTCTL